MTEPMWAGLSDQRVGTPVLVTGIEDPHDEDLNGRTGVLCQPFRTTSGIQDVGVKLDPIPDDDGPKIRFINLKLHEFEVI